MKNDAGVLKSLNILLLKMLQLVIGVIMFLYLEYRAK